MTRTDNGELRRASVRLAIQFAALIVVLFVLLGAVVYAIVSQGQDHAVQRTLVDAARIDSPRDAPAGVFVTIIGGPHGQDTPNPPAGLPDQNALDSVAADGRSLQETKTLGDRSYVIFTTQDHGHLVQVAIDRHESQEELQRLVWALVISGLIAAVAASLIAAWMARRSMRPLAEALELQRRFVADASHELRTPLTLLSTRAQLVRRRLSLGRPGASAGPGTAGHSDDLSGDVAAGLDEIVQDSKALTEILEDLLIYADPRETADMDTLDLAALGDEVVGTLGPDAEDHGIALRRTGSTDAVTVTGARVSLRRLFTALIDNALDHAKSSVKVEVTRSGRDATIRVIDDGAGFPAGQGEHVFERFASGRTGIPVDAGSTPTQSRHYGLGLALVAEVAGRHRGTVSVEPPAPGLGAVVVVRLPALP
jgi:two-component system, OmpR family, sensor kinase